MKIEDSHSAQKGNMQSARKKTPGSEKNEKNQMSGKKLVQARLPFKILAGATPKPKEDGILSPKIDVLPKKRKLSYTEESENSKKIGKSDSKENLTIDAVGSPAVIQDDVVIVLDDESKDEVQNSPKTPIIASQNKKTNKNTPHSAGSATKVKLLRIRLPLSGGKKRKSKRASCSTSNQHSDSSDIEIVPDDAQNPTKKAKIQKETTKTQEDPIQGKSVENNDESKTVKLCKTSKITESHANNSCTSKENDEKIIVKKGKSPQSANSTKVLKDEKSDAQTCKETDTPKKRNSLKNGKNGEDINKSSKKLPTKKDKIVNAEIQKSKSENVSKTEPKTPKSSKTLRCTPTRSQNNEEYSQNADKDCRNDDKTKANNISLETSTKSSEIVENKNDQADRSDSSEPELISDKTSIANTSISSDLPKKALTPKQIKLAEQRKKAREEKELKLQQLKEERDRKLQEQREERERKLQEEKLQKQKEREERELQRKKERDEKEEQKRREKEEKEEQRRKEKEDKERKRLAEIEAKNEEKRKKDEEKLRKEQEEENKKKKAAEAFTKFFVPKTLKPSTEDEQESRDGAESVDSLAFRPFQIKGAMKLAPLVRREFKESSREKLDSFLQGTEADKANLYINELKSGKHTPLKGFKTVLKDSEDDDVIVLENELETASEAIDEARPKTNQTYKAKFYFFRENQRPPFYGTWRKKSTVITPRRPFALDKKFFDYEVDSDEEWEEEEPGESLNGSEDEKDESEDEDYEVDNEWFVPHGHLSDEEIQNEDELGPDTSREAQKAKLKALQQEFAQEMKKKTEKIKPRLIGAIWEDENGNRPKLCPPVIWDSLFTRAMIICEPILVDEPEKIESEPNTPPQEKQKRLEINEPLMGDLVRLVHGNRHSRVFLIKEYMEHVSNTCDSIKNGECLPPTKSHIREKIDEISEWSVVDASNSKKKNKKKLCWVVASDVLDKYSLKTLGLRNEWSYKLKPKFDHKTNEHGNINETREEPTEKESCDVAKLSDIKKKKNKNLGISKFAKVVHKEEKQIQQTATDSSPSVDSPKINKTPISKSPVVKKRVALLMSVPPGQQFSQKSKNALISNFLQKNKPSTATSPSSKEIVSDASTKKMDVDEVVELD